MIRTAAPQSYARTHDDAKIPYENMNIVILSHKIPFVNHRSQLNTDFSRK